jgi:hypothetical protein
MLEQVGEVAGVENMSIIHDLIPNLKRLFDSPGERAPIVA